MGKKFAFSLSFRRDRFEYYELFPALRASFRMLFSLFFAILLPGKEFRLADRQLPEHLPAGIQLVFVARPIQPVIVDTFEMGNRNVKQVALNKLADRERHLAFLVGFLAVDPIGERDLFPVALEDSVIGDRPAPQIPGQIHHHSQAARIAFPKIDVPFDLAAQLISEIDPLLPIHAGWQPDLFLLDGGVYVSKEFSAVFDHDRLVGQ